MKLFETHQFITKWIKNNSLSVILSNIAQQIYEQKGYKYYLNAGTQINKFDETRYMFLSLPDNAETNKLEKELVQRVQALNKVDKTTQKVDKNGKIN